ncbi:hypothetical protein ABTY00_34460 [Streptomyces microflavus]|uniref:hypothetical protein n=1 Tax=Streptomyces microflavus TaxID=1919 RepID=UPI0033311831
MTLPADAAPEDSAAITAAAAARAAFARDLAAFRISSGERSYQQISKAASRVRLTPSAITDVLSGKRLPTYDFLIEFVRAVEQLGTGLAGSPQSEALVKHWHDRWVSVKSLEREALAPRKRVRDALIQQARDEAAEILAVARREVEAAFAAAGNHHVRHTRAKQLQEEQLRQAQQAAEEQLQQAKEAAEELLKNAQQAAHKILYEAQHQEDKAARMVRVLEQRGNHLSAEAQRLEAQAARLATVKEENRIEAARLAALAEQGRAEAARVAALAEQEAEATSPAALAEQEREEIAELGRLNTRYAENDQYWGNIDLSRLRSR